MSPDEFEQLRRVLRDTLDRVDTIVALPSGGSGRSYRVDAGGSSYVVKRFLPGAPVLLGPEAQHALLEHLAPSGLVPEPVACDAGESILITRFLEGYRTLSTDELRRAAKIESVISALQQLHDSELELPAFAPGVYAATYLDRIGGRNALTRADRSRYDELVELSAMPLAGADCLCHNDLTTDNILFGPTTKLIDFDYAVSAPAVLDLASLAFMNGLSRSESADLVRSYFDGMEPFSLAEFARVQRLVCLLAHFWSLAAAEAATAIVDRYRINDD
jgi:thiamine kinase-like enzyme